jgi:predicted nucleotidyltransferase
VVLVRIPTEISALLEELTAVLPTILGENMVGIYLYGSLTQGAFNPERSDVDCIVVTQHELTALQFTQLDAWLAHAVAANPWVMRLQISFLIRDEVLINTPKGNCLYQLGRLTRVGSDGNPIIWMNVLDSGVVLLGPPAESFVPPITAEILFAALAREVAYLREEIVEKPNSEWRDVPRYRAYAVLTLCRILYSHRHGTVVSKLQAAEWALRALSDAWHDVIDQALEADAGQRAMGIDLASIARFIEFTDAQLHAQP